MNAIAPDKIVDVAQVIAGSGAKSFTNFASALSQRQHSACGQDQKHSHFRVGVDGLNNQPDLTKSFHLVDSFFACEMKSRGGVRAPSRIPRLKMGPAFGDSRQQSSGGIPQLRGAAS